MTDIVERLRSVGGIEGTAQWYINPNGPEAADEIERLREQVLALQHIADRDEAKIERMRAALMILKGVNENEEFPSVFVEDVIESALEGK